MAESEAGPARAVDAEAIEGVPIEEEVQLSMLSVLYVFIYWSVKLHVCTFEGVSQFSCLKI